MCFRKSLLCLLVVTVGLCTVKAQLDASFTYTQTNKGCTPDSVVFNNTSSGATSYEWHFGDGSSSTAANPSHIYYSEGAFVLELWAYSSTDTDHTQKTIYMIDSADAGFTPSADSFCVGAPVNFYNGSNEQLNPYWDFGDGQTSHSLEPTHSYSSPGKYIIKHAVSNSCSADTAVDSVYIATDVRPEANFYIDNSTPVCPGESVNFRNQSVNGDNTFKWFFGNGDSSKEIHPNYTYAQADTYTITMITMNNCGNDTATEQLIVDSTVQPYLFTYTSTTNLCPGDTGKFNSSYSNNVNRITWDFDDGNISTLSNPEHAFSSIDTYKVMTTVKNICGNKMKDSILMQVNSSVSPNANFSFDPFDICPGDTVDFTNNSSPLVDAQWHFGDGDTSSALHAQHIYADTGNYNVQLIAINNCGNKDTATRTVTVKDNEPSPFIWTTPTTAICPNEEYTYNYWTSTADSRVLWQFGDGDSSTLDNPTHSYDSAGTYPVTFTSYNHCNQQGSAAQLVTVSSGAVPSAYLGFTPTNPCPGEEVMFWTDQSQNYLWKFGDGTTDTVRLPRHSYDSSGRYTVTVIISNDCGQDTAQKTIEVKEGSFADFTFDTVCVGQKTSFTDQSTNMPDGWRWDFGDGDTSTQQSPTHLYASAGTYPVSLTVYKNGCTHSVTKNVPVLPSSLKAGFKTDSTDLLDAYFTDTSHDANNWFWTFGDGDSTITQHPNHTYDSAGTYEVCLIANNNCYADTACDSVVITCPTPTASFDYDTTSLLANFTDSSTNAQSWLWHFGDGTTDTTQHPSHTYTTPGTYTVCQEVFSECGSDSTCQQVTVTCNSPTAKFAISDTNYTAQFNDSTVGATSWYWTFGDGQTDTVQHPTHTYATEDTYEVCLVASNYCGTDTTCDTVLINCPDPVSDFGQDTSGLFVNFTDSSEHTDQWLWHFGDGTTDTTQHPSHTYTTPGTYTVCLEVSSICGSDSVCQPVTVTCNSPQAQFGTEDTSLTVHFTDSTVGATNWEWRFGDGRTDTLRHPSHTYDSSGTYRVCLRASNVCGVDSVCDSVTVTCTPPTAQYTYSTSGNTFNFTDQSAGALQWQWSFGDGDTSNLTNPSHAYTQADTYQVCLTVSNPCGRDSVCKPVINTCTPPVTRFGHTDSGLTVQFVDSSKNATQWQWRFGDGSIDSGATPTHTYAQDSTYKVCLTTHNGCATDSACELVTVQSTRIAQPSLINDIHVYPNPTEQIINVSLNVQQAEKVNIEVINMLGQSTRKIVDNGVINQTYQFNMSDARQGVYFVKVQLLESGITRNRRVVILR